MSEYKPGVVKPVNPSLLKPTSVYLFLGYFLWPFSLIGLAIEKEDDFIRFHCAQAMAFIFLQLAISVLYMFSSLLMIILIGYLLFPLVCALQVASVVFMIIAIVKAAKGEKYLIPLIGAFAEKNIQKWFLK